MKLEHEMRMLHIYDWGCGGMVKLHCFEASHIALNVRNTPSGSV